jgi:thiol-disulfide isomerase/thioredoxin
VTSNSFVTNRVQLDTTLAVYTGGGLTNLVRVVSNDDTDYGEFGATWSRAVFRAFPDETLWIAVDSIGATGSIQMRISLAGPLAQPWTVTNLQGQLISSTDFAGQVVMVDFWETTCGACVEELPDVIRVQNDLHSRGFTFLGLSGDPNVTVVTNYLATNSMPNRIVNYPIAMSNPSVQTILAGGQVGFPTKLLLDREGRIVGQYLGGHDEEYYRGLVEPLLRGTLAVPDVHVSATPIVSGGVRISWPGTAPGYHVETTADPTGESWADLGILPSLKNNLYYVTVPAAQASQFFRLVKP